MRVFGSTLPEKIGVVHAGSLRLYKWCQYLQNASCAGGPADLHESLRALREGKHSLRPGLRAAAALIPEPLLL